jgi:hypothetical protein
VISAAKPGPGAASRAAETLAPAAAPPRRSPAASGGEPARERTRTCDPSTRPSRTSCERSRWPLLGRILAELRALPSVRLAVIFGSIARGTEHDRSDIDVLVRFRRSVDRDGDRRRLPSKERRIRREAEALEAELGAEISGPCADLLG